MNRTPLSLACWDYDRTRPVIDGRVVPDGIDLAITVMQPREAFRRMLEDNAFAACEMSLASHAILKSRGDRRFAGIPVMLSKMFRHSGMYVRADAGIASPAGLAGKRIGTNRYGSTGLVYMRGLLQHEYGVPLDSLRWCIGGLSDPHETPQVPANLPKTAFDVAPPGKTLEMMLEEGALDAIFSNDIPHLFLNGSPRIARLFPNFKTVEQDYYRRTHIFPVMHVLVLREDVHRAHPHVAANLYRAFCEAKHLALKDLYDSDALHLTLPFLLDHIEDARECLGPDFWSYGMGANRPALEALGRYIHEQGLAPRVVSPEDLFVPGAEQV
jgi:4,5-dihydroxyphthalate decarboxylase